METTAPSQPEQVPEVDSLLFASLIFRDVNRTVTGIQVIVTGLIRYALLGASITDCLIDLTVSTAVEGN